ncbi:MAG: tRNA (N6-isopentenyl adenosine(37)-C2)-methylthiotransferase MiaB [Candidatus Goldiibacteriota bacterium]
MNRKKGSVFIHTFGCQMNEYDSERMAGALKAEGFEIAPDKKSADYIIVNTCSVRKLAEEKALSFIGAAAAGKKVIAAGCMAQNMKESLFKKFPRLFAVVGTYKFSEIAGIIESGEKKAYTDTENEKYLPEILRKKKVSGFVTVMQGCNNFCSYCIVPYVRGRERSRGAEEIKAEVRSMAEKGFKEVTLLGQNVNSYYDKAAGMRFPGLLRELSRIDGIDRLRFMTSHPKDLSDELIRAAAQEEKIARHFHLPVQSGSNSVLEKMNRRYSVQQYKERIKAIREKIPGCAITTDILVGFPGETDRDFDETAAILEEVRFDSAFVFKYSERKGTKAESFADDVPKEEKTRRINYILELQKKISDDIISKETGKVVSVLGLHISSKRPDEVETSAESGKKVFVKGGNELIGKMIKVRLLRPRGLSFEGGIIQE